MPPIVDKVRHLPDDLVAALLKSLVGLYCDPKQEVRVRDNVRLVAAGVWKQAPAAARGDVGLRYASYSVNADVGRKKLAHEFLELVDGLTSLPDNDKALEISTLVQQLEQAHDAMNNFYNEPGIARQLKKFIGADGQIPEQVNDEYVRVLVRCRVGRRSGAARDAVPVYDELIDLFQEPQTRAFVDAFCGPEVAERLDDNGCAARFRTIAKKLLDKTVDRPLKRVLTAAIEATDAQLPKLATNTAFKNLLTALLLS